jgi:8-oxo-dGTP pyrophosphatase MutT (NUDIX family)
MTANAALADARLARIAQAVQARAPMIAERDEPFFEAAVALVLRTTTAGVIELLFIKRAERDDDPWSGQIALPGGRYDPDDESLEATAVRETFEEVSIDLRRDGAVIGQLDEIRPRIPQLPPVIVRPYVATVGAHAEVMPSDEVAEMFWAPLDLILAPESQRDTEMIVREFRVRRSAIHYRGHIIWGMTEAILRHFQQIIA